MISSKKILLLIASLALYAAICTGCTDNSDKAEPTADIFIEPDAWGPYAVGVREYLFTDSSREDRPLPTLVYYPAEGPAITGGDYFGVLEDAAVNARPDAAPLRTAGPFPIIIFSHGSGGQKEAQKYLLEYLASQGFIGIAPDHTGNVTMANFSPDDPLIAVHRPLDIIFVLDEMLDIFAGSTDTLSGLGDETRIGVSGHSFGGYTGLALIGTEINWDMLAQNCTAEESESACAMIEHREQLEAALPDTRLKAFVSLAHCGADYTFGPQCDGASGIGVPLIMMAGTEDVFCIYEEEVPDCYEKTTQPVFRLLMYGGAHVGFTDVFNEGGMATSRMHELIQRYAAAFFGYYIKGDARYLDYLGTEQAELWSAGQDDFEYSADPDR